VKIPGASKKLGQFVTIYVKTLTGKTIEL